MADIDITCGKCGNVVTISEFADPTSIVCRKCGEKLQKPGTVSVQKKQKPTVRVLKREETAEVAADEPPPTEWRFHKHTKKEEIKGQSAVFSTHHIGSWVVFLVLGAIGGALRYGGFLDPTQLAIVKQASPFALLAVHIIILLAAFRHSIFQGTLGIMLPPYPYYFLFAVSDEFYLRAIVGGVLIGIGQDGFTFVSREGLVIYNAVTGWIASGGG